MLVVKETKDDEMDSGPGPIGIERDCVGCEGFTLERKGVVEVMTGDDTEAVLLGCTELTRVVVTGSDSSIVLVNTIVSVEGGTVLGTTVTVLVVSKLSVTVLITVAGEDWVEVVEPPSTGTTEYGTRLPILAWFWESRGRVCVVPDRRRIAESKMMRITT